MKGINRFVSSLFLEKRAFASRGDCVFISHSRLDKPAAIEAADLILDLGVDIYFDKNDCELQRADQEGDDRKVVECIEKGIANSTHLLGIITENTKKSWWVPYEIGSATGRDKPHAHLITKEVTRLPSFIKASKILLSLDELKLWIPYQKAIGSTGRFLEQLERQFTETTKSAAVTNFSRTRSINDLTFY